MMILDVFYVALATIAVMVMLQISTFLVTRMMYPPEPKIVYRDVMPQMPPPQPQMQAQIYIPPAVQPQAQAQSQAPPTFTQQAHQEVKLPEYEPRSQTSDSLRMDPQLPPGLAETRPDGT
jgi:hypothetical protein